MKRYPEKRKQALIEKIMPPNNVPVPVLAEETGISDVTLYHWRNRPKREGWLYREMESVHSKQ